MANFLCVTACIRVVPAKAGIACQIPHAYALYVLLYMLDDTDSTCISIVPSAQA